MRTLYIISFHSGEITPGDYVALTKNRRHQDLGVKKKRSAVIDIVGNIYYNHCRQGYTMTVNLSSFVQSRNTQNYER